MSEMHLHLYLLRIL